MVSKDVLRLCENVFGGLVKGKSTFFITMYGYKKTLNLFLGLETLRLYLYYNLTLNVCQKGDC